jgi:lipoprotein-anchoring transpeptidase ErfK/SrfK
MNFLVRSLGVGLAWSLIAWVSPVSARPIPFLKPQELIQRQAPPVINRDVYDHLGPNNAAVVVSLSRQRVYVMAGQDVAIDSPVSSGKRAGMTPTGDFTIVQKDKDHRSNVYGNFVDAHGRVVRAGVSSVIDSAPSGTHFEGAPMSFFMRITWEGVGLHVGILPGYAASHGCIRLPHNVAQATFMKVRVGTPVRVLD